MKEKLSAWMDGELSDEQVRSLLLQLKRDADLRCNWNCYHLIGDALRGVQRPDLCARICAQLDAESTALVLQRRSTVEKVHWLALWIAASVAAVLVGWMVTREQEIQPPQDKYLDVYKLINRRFPAPHF
jgi:sigma-E factor negative regulatory protein RseA